MLKNILMTSHRYYKSFFCLVLTIFWMGVKAQGKTEILLVGSDHLNQVYNKDFPATDALTPQNQNELTIFTALLEKFQPEMIMVEVVPQRQKELDGLYYLYLNDKLDLQQLEGGRDEVYQIAFRMGKNLGLQKIVGVNSKGGTSQSILQNGENIEIYNQATLQLREVVKEKNEALRNGDLSLKDYLIFLNSPQAYNLIYHLRYITPARVRNGVFINPDEMVDTAFVDEEYIGAELISIFKNRDYKIYSNIVKNQMEFKPQRMLLIIGVAHIGSLKNIFRDDPEFKIVDALDYLEN